MLTLHRSSSVLPRATPVLQCCRTCRFLTSLTSPPTPLSHSSSIRTFSSEGEKTTHHPPKRKIYGKPNNVVTASPSSASTTSSKSPKSTPAQAANASPKGAKKQQNNPARSNSPPNKTNFAKPQGKNAAGSQKKGTGGTAQTKKKKKKKKNSLPLREFAEVITTTKLAYRQQKKTESANSLSPEEREKKDQKRKEAANKKRDEKKAQLIPPKRLQFEDATSEEAKEHLEATQIYVASSLTWLQFVQFLRLVRAFEIKVRKHRRTRNSTLSQASLIFGPELWDVLVDIGPYLIHFTAKDLLEARRHRSAEGVPLSGDTPYVAAFSDDVCNPRPDADESDPCSCYRKNLKICRSPSAMTPNGQTVEQRILTLTTNAPHKVFIDNLHPEIGARELMMMFCRMGSVVACEIFRERIRRTGDRTVAQILSDIDSDSKGKLHKPRRPPLRRQVTGRSPVYAWVYFADAEGEASCLSDDVRLLGINFHKHESRPHPAAEKTTLYLGKVPKHAAGLQSSVRALLTLDGGTTDLKYLQSPWPQLEYRKETLVPDENTNHGYCLAVFPSHVSALEAFQKLTRLISRKAPECGDLCVSWANYESGDPAQLQRWAWRSQRHMILAQQRRAEMNQKKTEESSEALDFDVLDKSSLVQEEDAEDYGEKTSSGLKDFDVGRRAYA